MATGQLLGAPLGTGQSSYVDSLAFTADGMALVAGSGDGAALLWDVDIATWPQRACQMANRNLTRQEWQQYLGSQPYQTTCPALPAGS